MNAARVARTFRIDPIVVLDAPLRHRLIRMACHEVVLADENPRSATTVTGVEVA